MTAREMTLTLFGLLVGWHSLAVRADEITDGQFVVQSNLRAGVAKIDITPSETDGVIVTGHRRTVFGVHDPLRAGVLVLDDGETKAAIVTLDTIGAWDEMVKLVRERIEMQAGIPAANVMVTASHNHSGPAFEAESKWGRELIDKLGTAATEHVQARTRSRSDHSGRTRSSCGSSRR